MSKVMHQPETEKNPGEHPVSAEARQRADIAPGAELPDAAIAPADKRAGTPADLPADLNDVSGAPPKQPLFRRPGFVIGAVVVLLIALIFGIRYWLYARSHESTDDAFIAGEVVQISPKVSGYVAKVYITDNQPVKAGDLLAELDARDYEARLAQARAALESGEAQHRQAQTGVALTRADTRAALQQASAQVRQARSAAAAAQAAAAAENSRVTQAAAAINAAQAAVAQARAQVASAEAEAARTGADVQRYQQLYERDEISRQRLDQAIADAATARAQLAAARHRVNAAEAQVTEARAAQATATETARQAQAQINGAQAQIGAALGKLEQARTAPQQVASSQAQAQTAGATLDELRAQVRQAELQLSYTKIYAPSAGRVTRKAVEAGAFVQPGQPLLALVTGDLWVTANFKESQIGQIRPGQPVEIRVDAYPGKVFKGHVDSIQAGSGAAFSLLPPENATGNYVKVVQRVPVKIVFDERDPKYLLGPGMSVEPEVQVK